MSEIRSRGLTAGHPLARVARAGCVTAHSRRGALVGQVACGACWETAIRDDERVAVAFDLPALAPVDASLVDEVAVERACRGERVALTPVERAEVARRRGERARVPASEVFVVDTANVRELRRACPELFSDEVA